MPKIIFKNHAGDKVVEAISGDTLLEVSNKNDIGLFGGCSGSGVCGTCHVFIGAAFVDKLPKPTDQETDALETVTACKENSRLACQVIVTDDMDGMTVVAP
ncbi:MAG: 2Fe-2S iron-sulfur cluster binding domain-containing protein [Holosporales bacterium]|jgi:2Fe-2S ferredoxin|nr:2Fe-2S iron-sulfur cluster binding domain-containing protein [Holosporales bacterium]